MVVTSDGASLVQAQVLDVSGVSGTGCSGILGSLQLTVHHSHKADGVGRT